jgi:hypothetical protein
MSGNYKESDEENFLPGIGRENSFAVPENYFDTLSDRLIAKIEFKTELEEFPELSRISKKAGFELPDGYFKTKENSLEYQYELSVFGQLKKIKAELKGIEKEEYFETLDKKLASRIELASELKDFNLLSAIEKKNNYAVDPEYFETIADRVKERKYSTAAQPSLIEKLLHFIFKPQMIFAYSIVILAAIGLTWYFNDPVQKVVSGDCKTLACLEKNELLNEQNMGDFDEENLYDEVDIEILDKQLSGETSSSGDSISGKTFDSIKNKN